MTTVYIDRLQSPMGELLLAHAGDQLCMLDFEGFEMRFDTQLRRRFGNILLHDKPAPHPIRDALLAYFDGELDSLRDIPVNTTGTSFQRLVWDSLRRIPAGETWSYARLANFIKRPSAVRAVGLANSQNPVAIVVPCHRVIGSDGELTGYAGGIDRKRWLLVHEGVELPLPAAAPVQARFYF